MTRDPARFETVFGGAGATINPVYDAMLAARGQGAAIDVLVDINRSIMQGLAPVQLAAVPAKP